MNPRPGVASYLNALPEDAARAALARCCGARRWVDHMLAGRPFGSDAALLDAAHRVWWALDREDWLEAFSRHPRIGEPGAGAVGEAEAGDDWSRREQAGMHAAATGIRRALAEENRAYEARFGHVFLICATGRSAEEMLGELRRRLANDAATELRTAAGEQAKITRLRLEKLVAV